MNRKHLAIILPSVAGIAFCLVEAMKVVLLLHSSPHKDAASGRTEPVLFAPVISTDWDYITRPQIIVLAAVTAVALVLGVMTLTSKWWVADKPADEPGEPQAETPERVTASTPAPPPGRPTFGRARH